MKRSQIRRLYGKIKKLIYPRDFLLRVMPKNSIAAEIGVYKGEFSREILAAVEPAKLHLIDPWKFQEDDTYKDSLYGGEEGVSQKNMDEMYNCVAEQFAEEIAQEQVILHRLSSAEASLEFQDNYFDWIYIDGNHLYDFVKQDLEYYLPKIKVGGFIAGDDYTKGGWWQGGVKKAVDEFLNEGLAKLVLIKNRQFILQKQPDLGY